MALVLGVTLILIETRLVKKKKYSFREFFENKGYGKTIIGLPLYYFLAQSNVILPTKNCQNTSTQFCFY